MAPTPLAKLRTRKGKPGPGRLVVPLPSRPPPYQPGSGPPLQRIRLLPPRDSTAYIVERILLPSPGPAPADGKPLPRRMAYIVGWSDLPAARLLVPVMQVLEYVSPRALEEWEANMELELDEDRRILAEEKGSSGTQRKARPPAHTEIESAAVAEAETDAQSRPKVSAMSLSTPKKARLEDFEGFTDYEEGSPSGQLARESAWQEDEGDEIRVISDLPDATAPGWPLPEEEEEEEGGGGFTAPSTTPQFASASATQHFSLLSSQTLTSGGNLSQGVSGGFTPFNQNRRLYSMPQAPRPSGVPSHMTPTKTQRQSKPRKKSTPAKKADAAPEPAAAMAQQEEDWVVKDIQDVQLYEVEGRGLVRYFKVLWEGSWPPDQNPTWEPEENLPPNMVRNYFKLSKKKRKARANRFKTKKKKTTSTSTTTTMLGTGLHYRSVSEAFAGELADDGYLGRTSTGDDEEELIVDEDHQQDFGRKDGRAWL
ncbi:hypothetical protein L249_8617 [Ophiocordyceps polyrhachis-furcata BCC 54312]|uniref:Chromo domain-containing protein n=1 Tax=Ophiocordyceps polyrhachis-furcata BCC 54312 TaxID=1330021 RepID=A0A367L680_9HYPO|nr:hypothetical protein L249_8617 [Ophiocordyceps polyrhachis-furcata BCC 54312]